MGFSIHERLRVRGTGALLLVVAAVTGLPAGGPARATGESPQPVASDRETVPGMHSGDSIDDPAVWVDRRDPGRSLVLVNDKAGALDSYDLDGSLVQRITVGGGFWGNVDVRQSVTVAGTTRDLVGVTQDKVRFYAVDPSTRLLSPVTEGGAPIGAKGEGFCLYRSHLTGSVYGFAITRAGTVRQFELLDDDRDGLLEASVVREFDVGSEAEGCVADDDNGALYLAQEDRGLWRYDAEPGGGTTRQPLDLLSSYGDHLVPDVEGVTLVSTPDGGGYVIASAQNGAHPGASYFSVYRRDPANEYVKSFRVTDGTASDDCDRTDGITAVAADLGPDFPYGVFVCQDNNNDMPGSTGNQDLKLVRLEKAVDLPPPALAQAPGVTFVAASSVNANRRSFTVPVPDATRPGDTLLLLAAQGSVAETTGPGAGWERLHRVVDGSHVATLWQKVATDADRGSTVRVEADGFVKLAMSLAVYRGADQVRPVAGFAAASEPKSSSDHTTPVVDAVAGDRRLSWWSDKGSATTGWTAPHGEVVRAATVGTGAGRVSSLLTDAGPVADGAQGGLTAAADAVSNKATAWTVLLRAAP